jgi:hypothetical protein
MQRRRRELWPLLWAQKAAFILKPGFVMGQDRSVPESRVGDGGGYEIITLELRLWVQF